MMVGATVVEDAIDMSHGVGMERAMLAHARAAARPQLRVYAWRGDVLLVGRHHRVPASPAARRRLSGGRVVPAGAGFVQVALALPHRSAMESGAPYALRPEQTINRAVRGVMAGLEILGLEPYYPGRDLITVGGRPVGWISLAVEACGGALIEAGIAVERDFSALAHLADRIDPAGVAPVRLWREDEVTCLAREARVAPHVAGVGAAIVEGYRRRFGWEIAPEVERGAEEGDAPCDPPALERPRTQRACQLGVLTAQASVRGGIVEAVRLGGDVIAPVATLRQIETSLTGCRADQTELASLTRGVLAHPEHFLLGATPDDVAEIVVAAGTA